VQLPRALKSLLVSTAQKPLSRQKRGEEKKGRSLVDSSADVLKTTWAALLLTGRMV
jgi:hypothetical protein